MDGIQNNALAAIFAPWAALLYTACLVTHSINTNQ